MSVRQNSSRDKRVSKLTKESEKLRQEITQLEDALILHSRFQTEDETSIRGMIRREVGGPRWEHGGEGKLHTYRGNQDLAEKSGYDKRKRAKEKSSQSHSQRREIESHRATCSNSKTQNKQSIQDEDTLPKNKSERKTVDKTCLNGEWALKSERVAKKAPHDSNKGGCPEIHALKNKVLVKASAKVIKRKEFAPGSENRSSRIQNDNRLSNQNYETSKHSNRLKEVKVKKDIDKNKQDNDTSYSLSFLESLQEAELKESNLSKSLLTVDDKNLYPEQKDKSQLPDAFNLKKHDVNVTNETQLFVDAGLHSCESTNSINSKDSKPHRWAMERDIVNKEITPKDHPRTQRRNSVGGTCHQNLEENSKVVQKNKTRMSQPAYETDSFGKKDDSSTSHPVDFPLLFGTVHKTLEGPSQSLTGSVHVSLSDGRLVSNFSQGDEEDTSVNGKSSPPHLSKSSPSTKQSIIICDEEVQSWLENLGLQDVDSYVTLFSDHEMDMSSIKLLTASRLREMGIHALGPIMKIMKGVQVINRDSSLREDVENVLEEKVIASGNKSSSDGESLNKDEIRFAVQDNAITTPSGERETGMSKNEKSPSTCSSSSSLSWKKTSDDAEYVNLNDRSPVEEERVPQAVSIKEKSKKSDKEKKGTGPSSKSGQRKTKSIVRTEGSNKDENQPNSKVVRKPPVKNKDGISSAHEKYLERKKQEELRLQCDQVTSARQRQLRDKMAARHSSRQSSSLERKVSSSRSQKVSLNRTFSESQNEQDEIIPLAENPQAVEELLKTKPLGFSEHRGETSQGKKADRCTLDDEANVLELLDTKNLDQAVEKLADSTNANTKESLNLSIVRQLKQQLHHIEQHLVQKMEKPDEESMAEKSQEEMSQHKLNVNKESNVRTSARERRRQRTPKQFSTRLAENNDIAQEFLKVGSVTSHPKLKDGECLVESKGDLRNSAKAEESTLVSPHVDTSQTRLKDEVVEHKTVRDGTENNLRRRGWGESDSNGDRGQTSIEAQVLENIHINKMSRQTELSRGKLAMAQEYLRKIEIDKKDISFETKDLLGDGAFSQVYRGIYQGSEVAIKQLKTSLTSNDKNYFSAEVSMLQELRHPHVVMLLGVCTAYTCPVLVLEYLQGGNLHTRIHDRLLSPFLKDEFCQISRDIASGICYLHNHRPPVLHLDLKSRNVLLGLGNRAKVADFGFSKWKVESDIRVSRSSKSKLSQGSPAWMAPELLSAGEITPKADVYSFVIVLWEMLAREDPYGGCSTFQILERVRTCQRPPIPHGCPIELKTLIERCWEQNPCTRPAFKEILQDLDKFSNCEEWISVEEEQSGTMENSQSNTSPKSVTEEENIKETLINSKLPPKSGSLNVKEKSTPRSDDQIEHYAEFDGEPDHIQNMGKENFVDLEGSATSVKNQFDNGRTALPISKETVSENDGDISTEYSGITPSSFQLISDPVAFNEAERSSRIKSVSEIESNKNEGILTKTETRQFAELSSFSPRASPRAFPRSSLRSSQNEEIKESTTQILIESAHDTKKLDELLHKYLPSPRPRDHIRKETIVSSSGDASRKLLPLRQSLDKPKKPPKPRSAGRLPVSQSENFGWGKDGDISVSDKEVEDLIAMAKFDTNISRTISESSVGNILTKPVCNKEASKIALEDKEMTPLSSRSQTSKSPVANRSHGDEGTSITFQDMNIQSEGPQYVSSEVSSSKNFLDVTKEIEQTLSSLQNMPQPPSSSKQSPRPSEIHVATSIPRSDDGLECNLRRSIENTTVLPNSSRSAASDTQRTKGKSDENSEIRLSIPTDMSVDSLSLSLSDDADSIDFSTDFGQMSDKKKQSRVIQNAPLLPVTATNKSVTFSSSVMNNPDTLTKSNGNVRESFFLVSDFHLDLNELSDNDNDTHDSAPVISPSKSPKAVKPKSRDPRMKEPKLHPPSLSPTSKQHRGKHLHLLEHNQHQKKQSYKPGEAGISTKMSSVLKEKINHAKDYKEMNSSEFIPPPPPPFITSHQIKRNVKDPSNPVRSGVPIKSASSKPEVRGQSRFSVEPGLLLQQRNRLKSVLPPELSPLKETSHGRSMPSVASILKRAMDERRLAMGDNQESQEGLTTPDASWSIQD